MSKCETCRGNTLCDVVNEEDCGAYSPKLINAQDIKATIKIVEDKHLELLAIKPHSAHPRDTYLTVVLCIRRALYQPYVTWICNNEAGGLGTGHYFSELKDALEDFEKR